MLKLHEIHAILYLLAGLVTIDLRNDISIQYRLCLFPFQSIHVDKYLLGRGDSDVSTILVAASDLPHQLNTPKNEIDTKHHEIRKMCKY